MKLQLVPNIKPALLRSHPRYGEVAVAGLFVLRRTHPEVARPYRAVGYPVLPAIYIVMALFIDVVLLRYKPQYTWPGLIIVLLGIPVYYLWTRREAAVRG